VIGKKCVLERKERKLTFAGQEKCGRNETRKSAVTRYEIGKD
jgi:hypothetical protein